MKGFDCMKISAKVLAAFNARKDSTFNDAYNVANGLPTMAQYSLLTKVRFDKHGIFGGGITNVDIAKYIRIHGD
jgi:hypothetical protein